MSTLQRPCILLPESFQISIPAHPELVVLINFRMSPAEHSTMCCQTQSM